MVKFGTGESMRLDGENIIDGFMIEIYDELVEMGLIDRSTRNKNDSIQKEQRHVNLKDDKKSN